MSSARGHDLDLRRGGSSGPSADHEPRRLNSVNWPRGLREQVANHELREECAWSIVYVAAGGELDALDRL